MTDRKGNTLIKSSIIYGISHAIPAGLGFLTITICALYLSPAELGIIGLTEAAAILVAHLSAMGLPAGLRRLFFSEENKKQRDILISTILRGGIFLALSATIISLISGPILLKSIPTNLPGFFPYFALAIIYQIWYQFLEYRLALYQVHNNVKSYAKLQFIVGFVIFSSVIFLIVVLNKGVVGFLLGRVIAVGILIIFVIVSLKHYLLPQWCSKTFRQTMAYSAPLLPHVILMTLLNFSDRYILEIYTTREEVGQYTLAYTLGMAMYLVTMAFSLAWGPLFFKNLQKGKENVEMLMKLAGKAAALSFMIAILGVVISKDFVVIVFNKEYHSIAPIIPLVISGYVFVFLYSFFSFGILHSNKTTFLAPITATTTLINIGLNIFLIPKYGMQGAAWATAIAFAFQASVTYIISNRVFPMSYPLMKIFVFLVLFYFVFFQTQLDIGSNNFIYWSGITTFVVIFFIGFSNFFSTKHHRTIKT